MPRVLVIVVTYQAESWLSTCLGAVRALGDSVDLALLDNASTDGTRQLIDERYRGLITYYLPIEENLGFGRAHNYIFAQPYVAQYDYVFLLNQDAAISRQALLRLVELGDQQPGFGIISPMHYWAEGQLDLRFARYAESSLAAHPTARIVPVPFVNAALWLIPTAVIRRVGGFNPVFPHYGEDRNYAQRVLYAGFKIGVARQVSAYHLREQVPIPPHTGRSPYQIWLGNLHRLVDPAKPIWKAVAELHVDYLKVLIRTVRQRNWSIARDHLYKYLSIISELPGTVRYRQQYIDPAQSPPRQ